MLLIRGTAASPHYPLPKLKESFPVEAHFMHQLWCRCDNEMLKYGYTIINFQFQLNILVLSPL